MQPNSRKKDGRRTGSAMLEFTLVGIPTIFVLISTFEIARGMWIYGTVSNAVREGTRFTIVKGSNCAIAPNACSVRISDIAARIQQMGPGLLPQDLTLSFTSDSGTVTCGMRSCLQNNTAWPPTGANAKGQSIKILGAYAFRSAIAMFWPGAGRPVRFAPVNLTGSSQEVMQF